MPSMACLILRSAQGARLEGRTTVMQPISSHARRRESRRAFGALTLDARFRGHDEKAGITYADFRNEVLVDLSLVQHEVPRTDKTRRLPVHAQAAAVGARSKIN